MSLRRFGFYASGVLALAAGCLSVSNCKDDDNSNVSDSGVSPFEDVVLPDSQAPPTKFQATAVMVELKNQPKTGVPDKIYPYPVVQLQSRPPRRLPDKVQKGLLDIEGMGCAAYHAPTHPELGDDDMGTMTVQAIGVPKQPFTCEWKRTVEQFKDTKYYVCNGLTPNPQTGLALRFAPLDAGKRFIEKTDQLVVSTTGGAQVAAIPKNQPLPQVAIDNLQVTTDLWNVTPDQLDGTNDFNIDYNCGGGDCFQGAAVQLAIITTDGDVPKSDSGSADPVSFPFPKGGDWGLILCQESMPKVPRRMRVDKTIQSVLGKSWTRVYTQLAVLNTRVDATAANDKVVIGAGVGFFGIADHK
ncbi:hypothetical protein LVJ94_30480 [Pendulispora rubella]|uniref:Uncharacterized protein n=1 Tax=Pendulispora rubella TaxID=2741070 RepID=A0ABZ2KRU4_9BACT